MKTVVVLVIIALTTVGCIPLLKGRVEKDRLPWNTPKGYAEFYELVDQGSPNNRTVLPAEIYRIDGKDEKVGDLSYFPLRVAATPGMHEFAVKIGNTSESVSVNIENGMVTPVKILLINLQTTITPVNSVTNVVRCTFTLSLEPQSCVPR
jgi:hypothetical protein